MNKAPGISTEFKRKLFISFCVFLGILAVGTLGFRFIEGEKYSLLDYLYMTVITVSTVGYGEVIDLSGSPIGRGFAIFLIFSGMGVILYFISNVTAFLIEGDLKAIFWRKKMQKIIGAMNGHYIICGAGTLGEHIIQEMNRTGRQCVVIDDNPDRIEILKEEFPSMGILLGDSTENDMLIQAGIERAVGIIIATGNDKDNLVGIITARQLRPNIRIVVRCNEIQHTEKLKRAGANSVVSSNFIGGLRMASEMIRPTVVSFLDTMLRDKEGALRIEEMRIPEGSKFEGKNIKDVKEHALLLAIRKKDGSYEFNPPDTSSLNAGEILIFMGTPEDRERINKLVSA